MAATGLDYCTLYGAFVSAAIIGAVTCWLLSGFVYAWVSEDVNKWMNALRESHLRQLAHDKEQRRLDRLFILRMLAGLQLSKNGKPDNDDLAGGG